MGFTLEEIKIIYYALEEYLIHKKNSTVLLRDNPERLAKLKIDIELINKLKPKFEEEYGKALQERTGRRDG